MSVLLAVLGFIAIVGALMTITSRNPVHCALWLVLVFIDFAALYVIAGAEFMAAVQIFVYAGGIMLLYLFVIMFVTLKDNLRTEARFHRQWPLVVVLTALFGGVGLALVRFGIAFPGVKGTLTIEAVEASGGNTLALAMLLFDKYIFPFELASVILVVAMIGAVVLARQAAEDVEADAEAEAAQEASEEEEGR
jgi:NADH-quinone oxidoreductase subunit J